MFPDSALIQRMFCSMGQDSPAAGASENSARTIKPDNYAPITSQNAPSDKYDEEVDDFDPRGTSSASKK